MSELSSIPPIKTTVGVNNTPDTFSNNKNPALRKAYFFERENGVIFHTDARDAWNILKNRKQVIGYFPERFKFIGSSNGDIYDIASQEAKAIFKEKGLEAAQIRLRTGWQEELEVARKNRVFPPDPDSTDLHGNLVDIRALRP